MKRWVQFYHKINKFDLVNMRFTEDFSIVEMTGMDSILPVDGRLSLSSIRDVVQKHIESMKKIEVGMRVYCDIHSQSEEHIVTHVSEERGFAGIDNEYWWPIDQCFPCDEVTLPKKRS